MYKCAIVGVSGNRAPDLAEAYRHIRRGRLVAISARTPDKLDAFGDRFGVAARYADSREMFEEEKPDLVHVNTPPNVRLEVFQAAEAAGVPPTGGKAPRRAGRGLPAPSGAFAETLRSQDRHQSTSFTSTRGDNTCSASCRTARFGEVRFIEASARMKHGLSGYHSCRPSAPSTQEQRRSLSSAKPPAPRACRESPKHHYAPDQCLAAISYDNGVSGLLRCWSEPRLTSLTGRSICTNAWQSTARAATSSGPCVVGNLRRRAASLRPHH